MLVFVKQYQMYIIKYVILEISTEKTEKKQNAEGFLEIWGKVKWRKRERYPKQQKPFAKAIEACVRVAHSREKAETSVSKNSTK